MRTSRIPLSEFCIIVGEVPDPVRRFRNPPMKLDKRSPGLTGLGSGGSELTRMWLML